MKWKEKGKIESLCLKFILSIYTREAIYENNIILLYTKTRKTQTDMLDSWYSRTVYTRVFSILLVVFGFDFVSSLIY